VHAVANFYKLRRAITVIYDEIDFASGKVRIGAAAAMAAQWPALHRSQIGTNYRRVRLVSAIRA
jgi:peptidyl-tRNA hydrolase